MKNDVKHEVKNTPAKRRRGEGIVVSTKMAKTVVVRVDRRIQHPKYGKYFTTSKTMKVHDEHGKATVGDIVSFEETRPISKGKKWRYLRTIRSAT